jgi:cytoskeletal protein RodZ
MVKRVVIIVVVLAVAIFAYYRYNRYDASRAGLSGQVFSNDPLPSKTKAATTSSDKKASDSDVETIVYPPSVTAQPAPATATTQPTSTAVAAPTPASSDLQVTQVGGPAHGGAPGEDTISANPPNGMMFAGRGKYQVYRQGNITWRVNTETGQTCVLFATDEEWKKPRVYRAGCGSSK